MGAWCEEFAHWVKLAAGQRILKSFVVGVVAIALFAWLYPFEDWGEWTGIEKDSNKSITTEQEINPKTKEVIKITKKETENFQSPKTLWDVLGLLGVIAIPLALFYFERKEQRRSEKQSDIEKKLADNNLREQALEAYIDRMSELLIDKELKVLISKELSEKSSPEYQKRDAAIDIARARTLSVLRRLDKDTERKGSVIRFLVDAELISHLDLNGADLSGADLSGANLSGAKLIGAKLIGADLSGANLSDAELIGAKLIGAKLIGAKLIGANLIGAELIGANLSVAELIGAKLRDAKLRGADLIGADLSGADLSSPKLGYADLIDAGLSGAELIGANLSSANLSGAELIGANLSGAELIGAELIGANLSGADLSRARYLTPEQVKQAKNWEGAIYDEEFRTEICLSPKPAK